MLWMEDKMRHFIILSLLIVFCFSLPTQATTVYLDKECHFLAGFGIAAVCKNQLHMEWYQTLLVVSVAAYTKEHYNTTMGGIYDGEDFSATVCGGICYLLIPEIRW